jgi:hypothetical protein
VKRGPSDGFPERFRKAARYARQVGHSAGVHKPGQPIPSVSSNSKPKFNDDGSIDLFFGPERLEGALESNFIGTNNGEGYFVVMRLYSPGQFYFDKTWKSLSSTSRECCRYRGVQ